MSVDVVKNDGFKLKCWSYAKYLIVYANLCQMSLVLDSVVSELWLKISENFIFYAYNAR